jgi:hypothetical protein
MPCFMRLMRSHNLAYFRWFLERKKSRLHIAVQTGFHAYSGNIKCVLCDRINYSWASDFTEKDTKNIPICVPKK